MVQERGHPDINIIVQKLTMVGSTRFEDSTKAPLGLPVNPASFVGKLLTQVRACVCGSEQGLQGGECGAVGWGGLENGRCSK